MIRQCDIELCRVFIVIDSISSSDRSDIAELYARIFSAPPWNEEWTVESALVEFDEVSKKQGFKGVCARKNQELVGFSWGYALSDQNTSRVAFDKIVSELELKGISLEDCFYGADTAVREDLRRLKIGTAMLKARNTDSSVLLFRTLNPAMVDCYRQLFGEEKFAFLEESAYAGGRIYVFGVQDES